MTPYHKPRRKRSTTSRRGSVIRTTTLPLANVLVGSGRRKELVGQALNRLSRRYRGEPDFTGWTIAEFQAYLELPPGSRRPPRRAGQDTVELVNRLAGVLPADAAPLARSITDAAPPAGERVNPALRDVLDTYLPETLNAFNTAGPKELRLPAERLLLDQLTLLRQATANLLRAEAEHNDRDLQIQEAFLRERFAELNPSGLDLPPHVAPGRYPPTMPGYAGPANGDGTRHTPPRQRPSQGLTAIRGRVPVPADHEAVVLMAFPVGGDRKLGLRLALPKGHTATLGIVYETVRGAIGFEQTSNRRFFNPRHPTGFRSPQVDVNLRFALTDVRRFMVYAASGPRVAPTNTVLFIRDGNRAQADLPTLLANHPRAGLTVVGSGHALREGLLLRNESLLYPHLQAACHGFGYGRVEWLDEHTPIV